MAFLEHDGARLYYEDGRPEVFNREVAAFLKPHRPS